MYGDDIMYPYPADMNKMKKKKQEEITFEIEEVLLDEHMMQYAKKQAPNSNNQNTVNNTSSQPQIPNESGNSGPSIENRVPQNNSKPSVNTPGSQRSSVQKA